MKVSVMQETLAHGLGIVGRAVSPHSTLPVLHNVLLATEDGRLRLSATNLEVAIHCWLAAKVDDGGAITVPARTFAELVSTLPKDVLDMKLAEKTQTLGLSVARTLANVKGLSADEFPAFPVYTEAPCAQVGANVLRAAIGKAAFAAATDESRPILTGVLLKFEDSQVTLTAADGYRLSVCAVPLAQSFANPVSIIMPARALAEVRNVSFGQEDAISITVLSERQALFQLPDIALVSQLIDGNFPDFKQIIPPEWKTRTTVDTAALLKAYKKALIFAREASNIVHLHVDPAGTLTLSAASAESGNTVEHLDATVEGDEIEIAFNAKYMVDVLSAVSTSQVALETTEASKPGVIRPVGDLPAQAGESFMHVIMPMHMGK